MSLSSSPLPTPPARVAAALAALRSSLVALPPGCVLARVVSLPGQVASLVSISGAALDPACFRLVSSVAGPGCWLVLVPVPPQPSLF
jgi:hypothetical protein